MLGGVVVLWLVVIALLHATLNLHLLEPKGSRASAPFRVGFLPVTCHLTCPVTDFINKQMKGSSEFEPVRFQGWPKVKEAFISGYLPATFLLAPLAMRLREDGVPIKIVYLGHRDGSAMIVHRVWCARFHDSAQNASGFDPDLAGGTKNGSVCDT
jgi:NitT/TauT family transport system substrate-binding protein